MKKWSLYFLSIFVIGICSCTNSNSYSKSKSDVKDTLYNDNIQGMFYDTPFGASKEVVIKNFEKHGFYVVTSISTDALLHFRSNQGSIFTFGNMPWEMLDVALYNDKFSTICFMNASKDKASAIEQYDGLLSAISKKYDMMEQAPKDTTVYKVSVGYSKIKRIVAVACYRYETVNKDIWQGVSLEYSDESFYDEVSDEL